MPTGAVLSRPLRRPGFGRAATSTAATTGPAPAPHDRTQAGSPRGRPDGVHRHGRARPPGVLLEPAASEDWARGPQGPPAAQPEEDRRAGSGARRLGCTDAAVAAEVWDTARDWCDRTGSPVPKSVRAQAAPDWDAHLEPVLAHYESLPPPARGRRYGHNLAERALRRVRPRMKISGCCRTRGLIETARKWERNPLDLLRLGLDTPEARPDPVPPWTATAAHNRSNPALGPPGLGYLNSIATRSRVVG